MSSEVVIIATVKPAAGKLERVRELFRDTVSWIQANEPGTLEISGFEDTGENDLHFSLFERYESEAAMKLHESSQNYKALFKALTEEKLFDAAPIITRGILVQGFKR